MMTWDAPTGPSADRPPTQPAPDLLADIGLAPGEPCAITGSGGKTTLLWHLADLARHKGRVLVSVTAKMLAPRDGLCDRILLDPLQYDPAGHRPYSIQLAARGMDIRGKLLGIDEGDLAHLNHPDVYLIMEADGSRGLPLKMWHEHEPPVLPGTALTLGVIPITALGHSVGPATVYNWPAFAEFTGLQAGEPMTREAFARIVFDPMGLFKGSPGRRILIINQADDGPLFEQALALTEFLAADPRSQSLSAIISLSLEERSHEDHRHYSCRRIVPADEPK